MRQASFLSDDTEDTPEGGNLLIITQREDLDIYIKTVIRASGDRNVAVRASGSRHPNYMEIIKKFSEIIDLINEV